MAEKWQFESFPETIPPKHLSRIIKASQRYTDYVNKHRIEYPPRGQPTLPGQKPSLSRTPSLSLATPHIPDPQVVQAEVMKTLSQLPLAGSDGDLILGEWNFELLDLTKAEYFMETYKVVMLRHHLFFCAEVTAQALRAIGDATGYQWCCSWENDRHQAVGFLIDTRRLEIIEDPILYDDIADIDGIPSLRPAMTITLQDKVTRVIFTAVVVHLKSMVGGPWWTGVVRFKQCVKLIRHLGTGISGGKPAIGNLQVRNFWRSHIIKRGLSDHGLLTAEMRVFNDICTRKRLTIIGGDFNCRLNIMNDVRPLGEAGYQLVYPHDAAPTEIAGPSRLDGFFRDQLNDTACGANPRADGGDDPFSDNPSTSSEIDADF